MIPLLTQWTFNFAGGLALFALLAGLAWSAGCWLWARLTRGR